MATVSDKLIKPGDEIHLSENTNDIILGPNIIQANQSSDQLIPTTAGLLNVQHKRNIDVYHIETNTKRYTPQVNDLVVGIITHNFGELFRVNLNNFSSNVVLNRMAFPNATKKNRPNLAIGDTVYARVESAERDLDVELSCVDPTTGKDGGFGLLKDGYMFEVKLGYARYLLFNSNAEILDKLVTKVKFELAIGANGRIWVKTDNVKSTIAVANAIQESQNWSKDELSSKVDQIFKETQP